MLDPELEEAAAALEEGQCSGILETEAGFSILRRLSDDSQELAGAWFDVQLQNAAAGLNFQGTGSISTPLGAEVLRSSCVTEGTIIGLDRRYALEMVQAGEVSVEYDKLIDRQLERAAITSISGFGKIMPESAKVLVI